MNQVRAAFSDIELCAYLDGELAVERRAEIEAWLARRPEARTKLESWRRQAHMLRASFGPMAHEPLPRHMTAAVQQLTEPAKITALPPVAAKPPPCAIMRPHGGEPALLAHPPRGAGQSLWRYVGLGVAAVMALAGVVASGLLPRMSHVEPQAQILASAAPGYSLTRRAVEAHVAFAPRAERLLDVRSADPATLGAAAAQAGLEARMPGAVNGLRTLGLRLTPAESGVAVLLLFEPGRYGPVSLLMARAGRGDAPGVVLRESGGLTVASFMMDGTAYALTSAAPRDQMVDWASALRQTLIQPISLRGS